MSSKRIIAGILETALRIIIFLFIISFVYKAGVKAYDFGYRIFAEKPMSTGAGRDVVVTVPDGKSARGIGEILKDKGLIRDENLFFCQELLSSYHGRMAAGTYTLNTSMTATEMMSIMSPEEAGDEEKKDSADKPKEKDAPYVDETDEINEDLFKDAQDLGETEEDALKEGTDAGTGEEGDSDAGDGNEGQDAGAGEATQGGIVETPGTQIIPADVSIEVNN